MKAHFVRGAESREEILDNMLNRKIEIELSAHISYLDDKGKLDLSDKDSKYLYDTLQKSGVYWKIIGDNYGPVDIEVSGTKKQLITVLVLWDDQSRSEEELAKALENWEGDEEELWDILG